MVNDIYFFVTVVDDLLPLKTAVFGMIATNKHRKLASTKVYVCSSDVFVALSFLFAFAHTMYTECCDYYGITTC